MFKFLKVLSILTALIMIVLWVISEFQNHIFIISSISCIISAVLFNKLAQMEADLEKLKSIHKDEFNVTKSASDDIIKFDANSDY